MMQTSFWALVTDPGDLLVTLRLDDNAAKVSVLVMVPLALQVGAEKADVWAALLLC